MTSERSYKPAYSNDIALRILRDGRGTQFDPKIVDVFIDCFDEIATIQQKYADPVPQA
ncbi:hypothetical protein D3C83_198760 [compost metagenome]